MKRQFKLLKPYAHRVKETTGVVLVLEADHDIVGIAYDDHATGGLTLSPALAPQVKDLVQVKIPKQQ